MRRSKVDLIYEPLRRELLQLPVGSRAGSIRELMRRYETSQLSITRVLSRLIDEGLLARRPDGTLFISGEVDRYKDSVTPAVILIPGKTGSLGLGQAALQSAVERAVGADIS